MPDPVHATPLHAYVHTSFRTAFGEPHNTLQKDHHWALESTRVKRAASAQDKISGDR